MSLMSLSFRSSTSRSSTSDVEAPAFTANCRRVHQWNLEDGAKVTLYQKGERLQYQWKLHQETIEGKLKTDGNVEEALENYRRSSPFRIGNKVHFVRPQASELDPSQYITRDLWALTLVCHGSTRRVFSRLRTPGGIFGHSMIILEKLDNAGKYNSLRIHLTYDDEEDRIGIEIMDHGVPRYRIRSETYLQSASMINQMIQHVLEQKQLIEDAYAQGTPLPFNFAEDGFQEGTPDKNCHTFSIETLAIADVHIPLVGFQFPNGSLSYIPRYSVGFLDELCKKMIDQGYPIEGILEEEDQELIRHLETSIKENETTIKILGVSIAATFLIPGFQLAIPGAIFLTSPLMIYHRVCTNKLEKRVKAIKVENLKAFYRQNQGVN